MNEIKTPMNLHDGIQSLGFTFFMVYNNYLLVSKHIDIFNVLQSFVYCINEIIEKSLNSWKIQNMFFFHLLCNRMRNINVVIKIVYIINWNLFFVLFEKKLPSTNFLKNMLWQPIYLTHQNSITERWVSQGFLETAFHILSYFYIITLVFLSIRYI